MYRGGGGRGHTSNTAEGGTGAGAGKYVKYVVEELEPVVCRRVASACVVVLLLLLCLYFRFIPHWLSHSSHLSLIYH